MRTMTQNEKTIIRRHGRFLEQKGYTVSETERGLEYKRQEISFEIVFAKFDPYGDILMRFAQRKEIFELRWFAMMLDEVDFIRMDPLRQVLILIGFIKAHYDELMDYNVCKSWDERIDNWLSQKLNES